MKKPRGPQMVRRKNPSVLVRLMQHQQVGEVTFSENPPRVGIEMGGACSESKVEVNRERGVNGVGEDGFKDGLGKGEVGGVGGVRG